METITPVKPLVEIQVPSTLKERVLAWMIGEVKAGRLTRRTMADGYGNRCTLGMIEHSNNIIK